MNIFFQILFVFMTGTMVTFAQSPETSEISGPLLPLRLVSLYQMTDPFHSFSAVTTVIEIEVEFCRSISRSDFKIRALPSEKKGIMKLTVEEYPIEMDCYGTRSKQTVGLSTQEIPYGTQLLIQNPLVIENRSY